MTQSPRVLCSHTSIPLSFSGREICQYVAVLYLEWITLQDSYGLESSIPFMVSFLVDHPPAKRVNQWFYRSSLLPNLLAVIQAANVGSMNAEQPHNSWCGHKARITIWLFKT